LPNNRAEELFAARVAADPSRPLLTFYDDATGERAELSARSLANWVAKTHYLLVEELGLGSGDKAFVSLPVHWLAVPILLGCWTAGLEVISDPAGAQVAFGDADSLRSADISGVDEALAVSLLSMARSAQPPAGMQDYATAVRPQPDAWAGVRLNAQAQDPALDGMSRSELVEAGLTQAAKLGLQRGGRLLWTEQSPDWIASVVAPLAVEASMILVRNADGSKTATRAASERATATY
jgi:uncharacterized protein (TIGR03089 family)